MNGKDDEFELSAELAALAERPGPASRVDVPAAVRQGKRRMLRQRAVVSGTAAVVAVLALGTVTWAGGTHRDGIGPSGSRSPSPTWSVPGPTQSPVPTSSATIASYQGKDPLNAEVKLTWLPSEVNWRITYRLGYDGMTVTAQSPAGPGQQVMLAVRLFPAARQPQPDPYQKRLPAPAVGGREAYWLEQANDANDPLRMLVWQTADGRWATLQAVGLQDSQREQWPLKIAAGAVIGRFDLPLPFRVDALPDSVKVSDVGLVRLDGSWSATMTMTATGGASYFITTVQPEGAASTSPSANPPGGPVPTLPPTGSPSFMPSPTGSPSFMPRPTGSPSFTPYPSGTPSFTPHPPGTPSFTASPTPFPSYSPPPVQHACRTANGLTVCVTTSGRTTAMDAVGGPDAWLKKLTLLGLDENNWTTDVIG